MGLAGELIIIRIFVFEILCLRFWGLQGGGEGLIQVGRAAYSRGGGAYLLSEFLRYLWTCQHTKLCLIKNLSGNWSFISNQNTKHTIMFFESKQSRHTFDNADRAIFHPVPNSGCTFYFTGHLPICAQPKHLQILCDDEEIDAASFIDLQDFLRQGYDVRCQLRPCSSIVNGPVVVQIQNYKDQVITLLTSLQLSRNQLEVC